MEQSPGWRLFPDMKANAVSQTFTELNKILKPTLTKNAARNLGINLRQKMTKVVLLKVNTFSNPNASKLEREKTM